MNIILIDNCILRVWLMNMFFISCGRSFWFALPNKLNHSVDFINFKNEKINFNKYNNIINL